MDQGNGLEHKFCKRLRELEVFSLGKRRLRNLSLPTTPWKEVVVRWGSGSSPTYKVTKANVLRLHQGNFRLNIRKSFCTARVVRHWNRLPRASSSLEVFKCAWMWQLGTWFSGEHWIGLTAGLDELMVFSNLNVSIILYIRDMPKKILCMPSCWHVVTAKDGKWWAWIPPAKDKGASRKKWSGH